MTEKKRKDNHVFLSQLICETHAVRGEEPQEEKSDWSELTARHSSFTLERTHKIENEPMQKGVQD